MTVKRPDVSDMLCHCRSSKKLNFYLKPCSKNNNHSKSLAKNNQIWLKVSINQQINKLCKCECVSLYL